MTFVQKDGGFVPAGEQRDEPGISPRKRTRMRPAAFLRYSFMLLKKGGLGKAVMFVLMGLLLALFAVAQNFAAFDKTDLKIRAAILRNLIGEEEFKLKRESNWYEQLSNTYNLLVQRLCNNNNREILLEGTLQRLNRERNQLNQTKNIISNEGGNNHTRKINFVIGIGSRFPS